MALSQFPNSSSWKQLPRPAAYMTRILLPQGLFFHIVPATNTSDSEESSSRAKCYKVRKMSSLNLTEMKVFVLRLKMNMAPEGIHQIKDGHRVASSSNSDHNADDDEQSQVSLQVQGHKAHKIPPQEAGCSVWSFVIELQYSVLILGACSSGSSNSNLVISSSEIRACIRSFCSLFSELLYFQIDEAAGWQRGFIQKIVIQILQWFPAIHISEKGFAVRGVGSNLMRVSMFIFPASKIPMDDQTLKNCIMHLVVQSDDECRAVKILDDYLMKSKNTGEFTLEANRTYTIVLALPEK
ncbi:unnamed protein product [Citrullus colocynthis]|uniref:Uncharacterized protein n=1 Tax=Citrullus colocynthis TaxID=252529 RepID=A0ABP0ZHB1_9ROSI